MDWPMVRDAFGTRRSQRLVGALLAGLVIAGIGPSSAAARSLVVDDDTGCRDARFSTIQSAVDAAVPGDEVIVCPGRYPEAINVQTDRLKIFSRVRLGAVIEQTMPSETFGAAIVTISGRGTLLRGFTITGVPGRRDCSREASGVSMLGTGTIDYNRITDLECSGVRIDSGSKGPVTVAHNEISNFDGLAVYDLDDPELADFVDNVSVHDNLIRAVGGGVVFDPAFRVKVQANTIEDTAGGIFVGGGGGQAGVPEGFNVLIAGNRVRRSRFQGIETTDYPGRGVLRVEGNGVFDNGGNGIQNSATPGYFVRNRSLGNGGFDCEDFPFTGERRSVWSDNVGLTDRPSTLCRAP